MTELSGDDSSLPAKPLAPVHVVIMPDASITFAVELNKDGAMCPMAVVYLTSQSYVVIMSNARTGFM